MFCVAIFWLATLFSAAAAKDQASPFLHLIEICGTDDLSFENRTRELSENGWLVASDQQTDTAIAVIGDVAIFARVIRPTSIENERTIARSELRQKVNAAGDGRHRSVIMFFPNIEQTYLLLHLETIGGDSISCEIGSADSYSFLAGGQEVVNFAGSKGIVTLEHAFAAQQINSDIDGNHEYRHSRIVGFAHDIDSLAVSEPIAGMAFLGISVAEGL